MSGEASAKKAEIPWQIPQLCMFVFATIDNLVQNLRGVFDDFCDGFI